MRKSEKCRNNNSKHNNNSDNPFTSRRTNGGKNPRPSGFIQVPVLQSPIHLAIDIISSIIQKIHIFIARARMCSVAHAL